MKGDFHIQFCGNTEVKFPCMTRLSASRGQRTAIWERKDRALQTTITKFERMNDKSVRMAQE